MTTITPDRPTASYPFDPDALPDCPREAHRQIARILNEHFERDFEKNVIEPREALSLLYAAFLENNQSVECADVRRAVRTVSFISQQIIEQQYEAVERAMLLARHGTMDYRAGDLRAWQKHQREKQGAVGD
ncbi:MAG: hypothetical protein AAGI34_05975 [Pseudomonadota bacterium]